MPCGGVAAIVTRVDPSDRLGRGADLLAYNSVLDALAARSGPVAPVRFGSVLADVDAVRAEFLAPDEQFFTQVLDSLTGREQFMFAAEYVEERLSSKSVHASTEFKMMLFVPRASIRMTSEPADD